MGKARKKTAQQFDVLLEGEFYGFVDSWTEYLCMERNKDGSITLTTRAHQILAEAGRYKERGWLPEAVRGKEVAGYDGDYVVGGRLPPRDGAELTLSPNQFDAAARWLISRKWDSQSEIGEAWARIRSALYGPEFFDPERPLPTLSSTASDDNANEGFVEPPRCADAGVAAQPGGHKPREIVIRCAGPSEPWVIWLELVFIEWSKTSYSVYTRTGEAVPGAGLSFGLLPRTAGRLSWREVLKFVQSHDLAAISSIDPQPINIYGVRPWQRDIIAAAMMRFSTIVSFLARLPEKELRSLHERLLGFLSENSIHLLRRLAAETSSLLRARTSLARIAQRVGSPDPLDAARLAEDCERYLADQKAEKVIARYRDTPLPSPKLFQFDYRRRPPCLRLRARLFEQWLRADPKPTGGLLYCGNMDDELPVLYWLLREQAAGVFQGLVGTHRRAIGEFVSWFLDKARPYAKYFTGRYHYTSSTTYTYGRPRFAVWALLGKEVQDAATSLGIPFPENLRFPSMPDLK